MTIRILGLTIFLAAVALGCTSDDASTPSPTPTPEASTTHTGTATPTASASATPWPQGRIVTPTPLPTRSLAESRAAVDEVIEAVTTGDVDHLEALIRYQDIACDGERSGPSGPPFPACEGAPRSTLVPAFPVGVCHAVWHRDPRPMLERFVERAGPLYVVLEGPDRWSEWGGRSDDSQIWDHRVVFESSPVGVTVGATVVIAEGRVTLLVLGCGPPNAELLPSGDPAPTVLAAGPAFVDPAPYPMRTAVPHGEVTSPRGDRTGVAEIDAAIEAIERHDEATIRQFLRTTTKTCTFGLGVGGTPCEASNTEGDIVERFPSAGGCHGGWFPPELDATAKAIVRWDVELLAVANPSDPGEWTTVFFIAPDERGGFSLTLDDGAIVNYSPYSCGSSASQRVQWYDVVLRGPAWPEDTDDSE